MKRECCRLLRSFIRYALAEVEVILRVEFGELRQFLRLDPASTGSSSTPLPAVLSPTSNTATPAYSTPQKPNPTLDDFSSLNLTPQEMFELEEELKAPGSTSSLFKPDTSDKNHSFISDSPESTIRHKAIPISPLNFSKNKSIGKTTIEDGEKVTRIPALEGVDKPLAEGTRDELDGIELTEEETRQLLRDLGLEDENDSEDILEAQSHDVAIEEPQKIENTTSIPNRSPKSNAYTALPSSVSSAKPSLSSPPSETQAPTITSSSTSIEGPSGAQLSAPLSTIEPLHLSAQEVSQLKESTPLDSVIVVEEQSAGNMARSADKVEESRVLEEPATVRPASIATSTVKEIKDLKTALNHDRGDTGVASSTLLPVGLDMDERNTAEVKGEGGFL